MFLCKCSSGHVECFSKFRPKFSGRSLKFFFCSKSKKDINTFFRVSSLWIFSSVHVECTLDTLDYIFLLKKTMKLLKLQKRREFWKFCGKKKWISSKKSSGSADGDCVIPTRTCRSKVFYIWLKVQRSLKPCPNLEKKFLFKISQGYVDCRLWQLGPNF